MPARTIALVLPLLFAAASAHAQQPPTPPPGVPPGVPPAAINPATPDDVMLITQGWLLLSQGSAAPAVDRARQVLARSPYSPAAAALAIEGEIARGGAGAALTEYERILGARAFEEPLLLRRVSQAVLREAARSADPGPRMAALRALASNGDDAARTTLHGLMSEGDAAALTVLAETGNADAVKTLVTRLNSGLAEPVRTLRTLGKARSQDAIQAAVNRLKDPKPEVRGAAAEALGQMKAQSARTALRAALTDDRPFVQVRAAAALLALGDDAGMPMIRELTTSDSAQSRLFAAEALSARPDAAWLELVRTLTTDSAPEVRAEAARLIAPMDPDLADRVLGEVQKDANPAIRDLAAAMTLRVETMDLRRLRGLMRTASLERRVLVAERVLTVTR